MIQPRTKSLPSLRAQLRIAIVGIYRCVQQWAAARHQPLAPVSKVPHDLLQPVDSVRDLGCSFEARIHCELPSVVEGLGRKSLLAIKVPVDSTFFQACRLHEIGQRGTVISSLIEDCCRLANNFLPGLLAFAHVGTPNNRIRLLTALALDQMRPSGLAVALNTKSEVIEHAW